MFSASKRCASNNTLSHPQSDPFVEIAKAQEGGVFTVVYRSQPIMKTLDPKYVENQYITLLSFLDYTCAHAEFVVCMNLLVYAHTSLCVYYCFAVGKSLLYQCRSYVVGTGTGH